jgi:hypothetical protein
MGCPVNPAVANIGASVDTEPSIRPSSPGCTFCITKVDFSSFEGSLLAINGLSLMTSKLEKESEVKLNEANK